ncbi:MAG: TonB-dependent receptor, partial [Prevotella sp.]|nr:TonB-dependent receptor [Prevotella sp.]
GVGGGSLPSGGVGGGSLPSAGVGFSWSLSADIYYNKVKDKIIAYPKGQQFRWTMLNLGEVDIRGLDVVGSVYVPVCRDMFATLRAQYTYQRAIDVTDAARPFYRHQIPYIPRHSGSVIVGLDWQRLAVNYSFIYTGERWNAQVNNDYNYMQPWYTSDLSASYTLPLRCCELRLSVECNNLLNQQYDVIANYPMPGRNFAAGLEVRF